MMIGSHVIKFWSSTQASLALSSGEAEYYGVVRAAGSGLGQQALFRDAGLEVPIRIWTDSSAAMGTSARQGLGKLRHLECHSLWLQQRLRRKQFELLKVPGQENPADLFTKHLESAKKHTQLISLFNCELKSGRADSAPQLKRAQNDWQRLCRLRHLRKATTFVPTSSRISTMRLSAGDAFQLPRRYPSSTARRTRLPRPS